MIIILDDEGAFSAALPGDRLLILEADPATGKRPLGGVTMTKAEQYKISPAALAALESVGGSVSARAISRPRGAFSVAPPYETQEYSQDTGIWLQRYSAGTPGNALPFGVNHVESRSSTQVPFTNTTAVDGELTGTSLWFRSASVWSTNQNAFIIRNNNNNIVTWVTIPTRFGDQQWHRLDMVFYNRGLLSGSHYVRRTAYKVSVDDDDYSITSPETGVAYTTEPPHFGKDFMYIDVNSSMVYVSEQWIVRYDPTRWSHALSNWTLAPLVQRGLMPHSGDQPIDLIVTIKRQVPEIDFELFVGLKVPDLQTSASLIISPVSYQRRDLHLFVSPSFSLEFEPASGDHVEQHNAPEYEWRGKSEMYPSFQFFNLRAPTDLYVHVRFTSGTENARTIETLTSFRLRCAVDSTIAKPVSETPSAPIMGEDPVVKPAPPLDDTFVDMNPKVPGTKTVEPNQTELLVMYVALGLALTSLCIFAILRATNKV